MTLKIPEHGDVRVCFIPSIPDHAVVIDVPDIAAAKLVHDSLTAVLVAEQEHHRYSGEADIIIQRFDEGWDDVDPSEYDEEQALLPDHEHHPVQHRDGKEPWCKTCGLNAEFNQPRSRF